MIFFRRLSMENQFQIMVLSTYQNWNKQQYLDSYWANTSQIDEETGLLPNGPKH